MLLSGNAHADRSRGPDSQWEPPAHFVRRFADVMGDTVDLRFRAARARALLNARRLSVPSGQFIVYELPPSEYDRRQTNSLIFESASIMRRVRDYPPNWRDLRDPELARVGRCE